MQRGSVQVSQNWARVGHALFDSGPACSRPAAGRAPPRAAKMNPWPVSQRVMGPPALALLLLLLLAAVTTPPASDSPQAQCGAGQHAVSSGRLSAAASAARVTGWSHSRSTAGCRWL